MKKFKLARVNGECTYDSLYMTVMRRLRLIYVNYVTMLIG